MILPGSYANGFAPRDGSPLYPELWKSCVFAADPGLGPSGIVLRDWSGYGYHGSLVASPVYSTGICRYAITLNGSTQYISLPRAVTNTQLNGLPNCAGSGWFCGSNIDSMFRLQPTGGQYIVLGNSGSLISHLDGGTTGVTIPTATVNNGQWHHVGFNRIANRSDGLQLFIDGKLSGTRSTVATALTFTGTDNGVNLGAYTNPNVFAPTNGKITDMRIYARDLTPREFAILALRPGIAYEMAPRRRSSAAVQFNRRRRLLVGAGS